MSSEKVKRWVKDGRVAVVYSPAYGAGISTWADTERDREILAFDHRIAKAVQRGHLSVAEKIAAELCPNAYLGGFRDARVEWFPVGSKIRISEYDGYESIKVLYDSPGYMSVGGEDE